MHLMDIAHSCDAQHIGHKRAYDGTCEQDGEVLTGAWCPVHGRSRRKPMGIWLMERGLADSPGGWSIELEEWEVEEMLLEAEQREARREESLQRLEAEVRRMQAVKEEWADRPEQER